MTDRLLQLYDKLGLNQDNGLCYFDKSGNYPEIALRYKNALDKINPQAFFCIEKEPFILFFYEDLNNETRLKEIHKQVWNFDKAPILVISTDTDIIIYNAFDFNKQECKLAQLFKNDKEIEKLNFANLPTSDKTNVVVGENH